MCNKCLKLQAYYGRNAKCSKCLMNEGNWRMSVFVSIVGIILMIGLVLLELMK